MQETHLPGAFPSMQKVSVALHEDEAQQSAHSPCLHEENPVSLPDAERTPSLERQLADLPELNILVLGETGVGKSTFINAFVNYISFASLDDALSAGDVQCVIPSSFTWQSLDGDDYIAKHINVVPNDGIADEHLQDENDGTSGESATQCTKTYTINVGNNRIRLIDTPGIGDTRGSSQDQKNMNDILAKLRTVKELHGILILLKPNNARLTVMFKFCLKELLSHLHRDAAKNIVFGFTNARNTSFRPGETYSTLKRMLDDDKSVGIQLGRAITYCFDSESFRCLSAHQQGVDIHDLGDIQDYRLSWEKSANEVRRMLEHLQPAQTAPHRTAETVDLHATRELVKTLTTPMADIAQTINNNIALQRDEQANLTDAMARGEVLETAQYLSKVVYEMKQLDRPRTVCSDKDCVEYKDDSKHYKSLCHDPCYLSDVEVDKIQCPELVNCAAFSGSQNCNRCGHSWQLHLHVLWEPVETTVQVEDSLVAQRLSDNASGVKVMETALRSRQSRIKQYEGERSVLQKAAGQFAVFLKNSSIKPYNDSKLEYLDHLIEEEKGKVQAGGSRKRLEDYTMERKQHEEETRALMEYFQAGARDKLLDQNGINGLIQDIFALELTGQDLEQTARKLEEIQRNAAEKAKASAIHTSAKRDRRGPPRGAPPKNTQSPARRGAELSFHEMLAKQQQQQKQPQRQPHQQHVQHRQSENQHQRADTAVTRPSSTPRAQPTIATPGRFGQIRDSFTTFFNRSLGY